MKLMNSLHVPLTVSFRGELCRMCTANSSLDILDNGFTVLVFSLLSWRVSFIIFIRNLYEGLIDLDNALKSAKFLVPGSYFACKTAFAFDHKYINLVFSGKCVDGRSPKKPCDGVFSGG